MNKSTRNQWALDLEFSLTGQCIYWDTFLTVNIVHTYPYVVLKSTDQCIVSCYPTNIRKSVKNGRNVIQDNSSKG
jgi:hypothetical protein